MRHRCTIAMWLLAATMIGCEPYVTILERNLSALVTTPRAVPRRTEPLRRDDARLAVTWVGHATTVVQMDDRLLVTDPVFTATVGQFSRRLVDPGVHVDDMPKVDVALVSHMHVDHLSVGSLDLLGSKIGRLLVPRGGLVYVPRLPFPVREVARWESESVGEMRITSVPVAHSGYRYGVDAAWMTESYTGWVVEYHGLTVYFAGDTAYDGARFRQTAERFPEIDLAILPIGPVEPHELARKNHIDGREAMQALLDLDAHAMVPIHFDTFAHGTDHPGDALQVLAAGARELGVHEPRIHALAIGQQAVIVPR
jgi:L-ascorbate metabolism protein UlaG (beta-lactamase superfamily)